MPIEPPPSSWALPDLDTAADDLVCVGADLEPGTLLAAYRSGLFPMPVNRRVLGWWSPGPRGVIPLDGLRITSSLRRSCRRFEIRVDTAFEAVVRACGDPHRPHGWITHDIVRAYTNLHRLGWAHSVEAWTPDGGKLVGGLYGIAVAGLFAGESMFHHQRDASKVALVALVEFLAEGGWVGDRLLDCQWLTPHLAGLGCIEVSRDEYRKRLAAALDLPLPPVFAA